MGRNRRIIALDEAAERLGLRTGMKPGEARAACPGLVLLSRHPETEQGRLETLADRLGDFSTEVALADELGVVLEVGRSLRLFGGIGSLLQRLHDHLHPAPAYHLALAPTAGAAMLCARHGLAARIEEPGALRAALGNLPAAALAEDVHDRRRLDAIGVASVRELLRLPREGLTRRFGAAFTRRLAEVLGEVPHGPPLHVFRRHFDETVHLDEETVDLGLLLSAAARLLARLEEVLRQADSAVEALRWHLLTAPPDPGQVIELRLGAPAWRGDGLAALLHLRLESTGLVAPVRALRLASGHFAPRSRRLQHGLPGLAPAAGHDRDFIDRLRARLGHQAVHGIQVRPEHRPELAWATCEPGQTTLLAGCLPGRPLWLLDPPAPLSVIDGRPRLNGALRLQADTERIRCGWWDGQRVFRDYRQALAADGRRLWLFRVPGAGRWYLHGLY